MGGGGWWWWSSSWWGMGWSVVVVVRWCLCCWLVVVVVDNGRCRHCRGGEFRCGGGGRDGGGHVNDLCAMKMMVMTYDAQECV